MRKSTEDRPGLRPWSLQTFLVALTTVAVAAAVQEILVALGTTLQFASFVPAILLASFLAGVQAAIFAAVLSIPIVWWEFLPPRFEFNPLTAADYLSFSHFVLLSSLAIWFAHLYWQARALSSNDGEVQRVAGR
jgi:K+-sensing histidine kinase KdpD